MAKAEKAVSVKTLEALKPSQLSSIQVALEAIPVAERSEADNTNLFNVKLILSARRKDTAAAAGKALLAKLG